MTWILWEMGVTLTRDQLCLFVIMEYVLWGERERERERGLEPQVADITNEYRTLVTLP